MKYIFLLLIISSTTSAQQLPEYVVYLVKGEVTVHKGKTKPVKVKQHQFIYATETLTIKQGGEVTLSNKEGNSFALGAPKTYQVSSLSQVNSRSPDNITKKYLSLLYHELIDPNHDYTKFKKSNVGGVWGGVSRGDCGNLLFPVEDMKTADRTILFTWRKTSSENEYVLKIYDTATKEIAAIPVKDTSLLVDLAPFINGNANKYYWRIEGKGEGCEEEIPIRFEIITKEQEAGKIAESEKKSANKANMFFVIDQLEKECFIPAAQKYFESSINTNTHDMILVKTYISFLLKYHMEEKAMSVWQESIYKKGKLDPKK